MANMPALPQCSTAPGDAFMLELMLRSFFWAACWSTSTWLLAIEKAAKQAEDMRRAAQAPQAGTGANPEAKPEAKPEAAAEAATDAVMNAAWQHPLGESFAAAMQAAMGQTATKPMEDDMANEGFPTMDVPESLRDLMKMGIEQARYAFENFATTSEKAMKALEANPAMGGTIASLNDKIAEITRKNADANFALALKLAEAKDFNEAMTLQSQHMKAQMESFSSQIQEIRELATKIIQEKAPSGAASPFTPPSGSPGDAMGPGGQSSPGFGGQGFGGQGFGGPGFGGPGTVS
jgi:phasin